MFQQSVASQDLASTPAHTTPAHPADSAAVPEQAAAARDPFIDHYFKRIDPAVAASFTEEQCEAIKMMFGARGIAKHALEVRRSLPIGKRRFYMVLLLGRERRTFGRLYSEGAMSSSSNLIGYAISAALWLVPAVGAALLLQALL